MGFRNIADGNSSAAFGTNSIASGDYSLALGSSDQPDTGARVAAGATNGVAIGRNAAVAAAGVDAIAFGSNASAIAAGSVALGLGSVADQANTISVGAAGSERRIVNVRSEEHTSELQSPMRTSYADLC